MVKALNSPTSNCLACSTSCSLTWNNLSLVLPKVQLGYPNKSSWIVPKVVAVVYGRGLLRESRFKRGFTKVVVTRAGRLLELLHGELRLYFANFCLIFYFSIQSQSVLLYTFELRKITGKVESQLPPFCHSGLSCSKVGKRNPLDKSLSIGYCSIGFPNTYLLDSNLSCG